MPYSISIEKSGRECVMCSRRTAAMMKCLAGCARKIEGVGDGVAVESELVRSLFDPLLDMRRRQLWPCVGECR